MSMLKGNSAVERLAEMCHSQNSFRRKQNKTQKPNSEVFRKSEMAGKGDRRWAEPKQSQSEGPGTTKRREEMRVNRRTRRSLRVKVINIGIFYLAMKTESDRPRFKFWLYSS